jgi:hypothetical protein
MRTPISFVRCLTRYDSTLGERGRVAVAFPDTRLHRKLERLKMAMRKLKVGVFWVDADGAVTVELL